MKTNFETQFRRRKQGKTNYNKRLKLLLSRKPRLVVRKSLNNIRVQIEDYTAKGDVAKAFAVSGELRQFGWKYSADSIPAAYLTGLLCGVRAKQAGVKEAILDIGLNLPLSGSRLYAALKGAIDAQLSIPASPECFPKEDRIKGAHIAAYASKLKKENPSEFAKRFSGYTKNNADPEKITATFEEVKAKIQKGVPSKKA